MFAVLMINLSKEILACANRYICFRSFEFNKNVF